MCFAFLLQPCVPPVGEGGPLCNPAVYSTGLASDRVRVTRHRGWIPRPTAGDLGHHHLAGGCGLALSMAA
jgi:hypothetical protein